MIIKFLSACLLGNNRTKVFAVNLLLLFSTYSVCAQKTSSLPHSVPEKEGVSSAAIDSFITAASHSMHEFHSMMFLRHGKVIAEGWWDPYKSTLKHGMYSTSKSFTSTAIGFAVSEGKISVNDKVTSFFPDQLPDTVKPYLAQLTIKNLLTMSVGQSPDPTYVIPGTNNWIKAFFATPILNEPGTKFLYNTMATYVLSAIVQKVTGQKVIDYLKPRLFEPLGITNMDWEEDTNGINTGGWGLRIPTEGMAKLGQLYLQKGIWNGKQLLPKAWVEEATTFKIDNAPGIAQSKKDSSDWMQGYCYQFWRCRNNAFRADGAFGQYIIMMPDQDAVVAITCETPNMQDEINLVWKYLLPGMHKGVLPLNKKADATLEKDLSSVKLTPLQNKVTTTLTGIKTYAMAANPMSIKTASVSIAHDTCRVVFTTGSASYTLSFASGKWISGKTNRPAPGLLAMAKENFSQFYPYNVTGSSGWQDAQTLKLKLRYIESPHSENITFHFNGDKLILTFDNSYDYGKKKLDINGELVK